MMLGIVGGLSPEVTAEFYLRLIEKSRKDRNSYPHIVIDSVPIGFSLEDEIIVNARNQEMLLQFLIESLTRLQKTDLIVIPCNTAHIFIEELRRRSKIPIVSIVEEVVKHLKLKGYRKAGLLATTATVKSRIYSAKEIEFVSLSQAHQRELSEIIVKIIRNKFTASDKNKLHKISDNLREKCDAVVLACSDLHSVLKGGYADSFDILAEAVLERLGEVYPPL